MRLHITQSTKSVRRFPHREEKRLHIDPKKNKKLCYVLMGYCNDIETLYLMRNGEDCKRELALFLYRLYTYDVTGDKNLALERTLALNASLSCPFSDEYVIKATESAEKKIDKGETYHYKLETIIQTLEITPEEMKSLSYLTVRTGSKKEQKQEYNRTAYLNRLAAEGKETKEESIAKRRDTMVAMLKEGRSAQEIMDALSISKATYYREKAAIDATNALEAARDTVEEATEIITETVEKAAEAALEGAEKAIETIGKMLSVPMNGEPELCAQIAGMGVVSKIQSYNYKPLPEGKPHRPGSLSPPGCHRKGQTGRGTDKEPSG